MNLHIDPAEFVPLRGRIVQADQAGDGAELRDLATLVDGDAIQVDTVVDREATDNPGLIPATAELLIDLWRRRQAREQGQQEHDEDMGLRMMATRDTSTVTNLEDTTVATMDKSRREQLMKLIATTVRLRRSATKPGHRCRGAEGVLQDVKRTRAWIDFGELGQWTWPITAVVIPPTLEPAPGQLELF